MKLSSLSILQMFAQKSKFFREAVHLLLGYKVDMLTEREYPEIRLRPMYAEHEDDTLLFQWVDDSPQLMITPFTNRLQNKVNTYLQTCNSIPAFLASIVLDQFEQQTFQP
jgi:Mitotic checkpoint protein